MLYVTLALFFGIISIYLGVMLSFLYLGKYIKNLIGVSRVVCLLALFLIFIFGIIEISPWYNEFISYNKRPSWEPLFSSADLYSYLFYSLNADFKSIPLSVYGPTIFFKYILSSYYFVSLFFISTFLVIFRNWMNGRSIAWYFPMLLILCPWVLIQFTAINKEIFVLLSLFSFLTYIKNNNKTFLLLSTILAFFSKAEFFVVYMSFLVFRLFPSRARVFLLLSLVLGMSLGYNYVPGISTKSAILDMHQLNAKFGFTQFLNDISRNYYLFAIVIVPRVFLSMFEKTKGYVFTGNPIENELSFIIDVSSEWIFAIMFLLVIWKRKIFDLGDDRSFLFWLFLIMVSTVPFPVFRYILPAYILLVSFVYEDVIEDSYLKRRDGSV